MLAEYDYDARGNCTVVYQHPSYGDLANLNPIRYRGYFYDFETGFYYLNSRYYDPQVRRFISIDAYVSTGQNFIGDNMYAYCLNNPVGRTDEGGYVSYECLNDDGDVLDDEGNTAFGGHVGLGNTGNVNGYKVNYSDIKYFFGRVKNTVKAVIESGKDTVFKSRAIAEAFITRYFPNFNQESAGNRSSQGWHWDYSAYQGPHINIYGWSESNRYFRTHIYWTDD